MASVHIPIADIRKLAARFIPTAKTMTAVGVYMVQQVKDRFASAGASGGVAWPAKKMRAWGYDDGRAILTGRTALLLESFMSEATDTEAVVFSGRPYAHVHQLGTIGKGGILPTIRPKRAKALFIPITDRAASSNLVGGIRVATRGPKLKRALPGVFAPLVRGRLKDGKLQKWDARSGEYVNGVPDFIFLAKVDIAPRPMLPDSPREMQAQVQFLADQIAEQP